MPSLTPPFADAYLFEPWLPLSAISDLGNGRLRPVVVMGGETDQMCPYEGVKELAAAIPGSRLLSFGGNHLSCDMAEHWLRAMEAALAAKPQ